MGGGWWRGDADVLGFEPCCGGVLGLEVVSGPPGRTGRPRADALGGVDAAGKAALVGLGGDLAPAVHGVPFGLPLTRAVVQDEGDHLLSVMLRAWFGLESRGLRHLRVVHRVGGTPGSMWALRACVVG